MGAEATSFPVHAAYLPANAWIKAFRAHLSRFAEMSLSPDSLVNYGRMVTAGFGLVAISLDPTRPSGEVGNVQIVLAVYLGFSFLMVGFTGRIRGKSDPARAITHAIDIAALSLLVLFSEELDSPFFVFFTFTLVTAALQWGMGGIFATALALQVLLVASATFDLQDGDSELNILIMRSGYCWVSAVMLGYFATYRERMRNRLARLAAWQPEGALAYNDIVFSHSLDATLDVLGAKGVVVLWKAIGAENGFAVVCKRGVHEAVQMIDGSLIDDFRTIQAALVIGPRNTFSADMLRALDQAMFLADESRGSRWRSMCVTKLRSQRHEGVVIVVDASGEKEQLAALADIVALRIAAHLAQLANADEQAEAAGLREREGLARDLHDGVLQHLTAAAIHLKVARGNPSARPERLMTVAEILFDQQQQIRQFVEGARSSPTFKDQPLDKHIQRLAATLCKHWGCAFEVHVVPKSLRLDGALVTELCLLFSEAAANAARHGQAQRIRSTITVEEGSLLFTIEDDGRGLAGSADEQAIPRSLSSRVAMLGGTLDISSSAIGVLLTIRIALEDQIS